MSKNNGTRDSFSQTTDESNGSDPLLTSSGIGEVKEALGRLYKKVNDLEISEKAEREQSRAELKAWAQTNLIQTQLLSKQTAVIELLTQELKNKENSSQQSELLSETLLQELMLLKNQLSSIPKSSPKTENLELKGLKNEVMALKTTLGTALSKLNESSKLCSSVPTMTQEERTRLIGNTIRLMQEHKIGDWRSSWEKNQKKYASVALAGLILFFSLSWVGGQIFPPRTSDETLVYLQEIWNRTGWVNTKLQRIEKKLGTARSR